MTLDRIKSAIGVTPYHEEPAGVIYCADCLDILPKMPEKCVDLTLTSPPYNMRTRVRDGKYTERETAEHFSKKYTLFDDAMPIGDYRIFHGQVLNELLKISFNIILNIQIVTGSKEAWFKLIGQYATQIKDIIIWDKGSGQPAMHPAVINRSYEILLMLESGASMGRAFTKSYFGRGLMTDIWRLGRGNDIRIGNHSAIFPLPLATQAIENWSVPGNTVIDCFLGSGTSLVAAKQLGRKFIGIEIEEKYCEISRQRLAQEILI